jgi:hypothetical protein
MKIANRPGKFRDNIKLTKSPNRFELLNNHMHV